MKKLFLIPAILILIASCRSVEVSENSDSFAHFDKEKTVYKSISADNVRIVISKVVQKIEENSAPELWINEIEITLKSKGYKLLKKTNNKNLDGTDFITAEFEVFYNGEKYIYSVSILTDDNEIYVAEAGGPIKSYREKETEILRIISSVKL